jgi:GNAT superfamily N-acetyltransferase
VGGQGRTRSRTLVYVDTKHDLRPSEIDAVVAMVDADGRQTDGSEGLAIRPLLHAALTGRCAHAAVVEHAGEIVGFAVTDLLSGHPHDPVAVIETVHVVPMARERGLDSWLVADALEWARQRGCRRLEVVLDPEAPPAAVEVVRRWGFAWSPGHIPSIAIMPSTDRPESVAEGASS